MEKIALSLPGGVTIDNPPGFGTGSIAGRTLPLNTLADVVNALNFFIFPAAGLLLLIYLVYGGFSYMTSRGDPKAIEAAKGKITGALVGFLIVFVAFWIVQGVGIVLGLPNIIVSFGGIGGGPPPGGGGRF